MESSNLSDIYRQPADLLRNLIRFNTTNPPGNELECINYIDRLLINAGFRTNLIAKDPNRPNLITRLGGKGEAPPLLLFGHIDVVTTANQEWKHPPFEGNVTNGYIWGRGTLDMKGGISMYLSAILRAKAEGLKPAGDIILAVLSDEEAGGDFGAKYIVKEHSDLFKGVRYALGEFGGVATYIRNAKFYPIQVGEKQICWMKTSLRGPSGHGSRPIHGGAMAKTAKLLTRLDRYQLPVHITPVAEQMVVSMASALPGYLGIVLRMALWPPFTDRVLKLFGGTVGRMGPLFRNTISPNIIRGGDKVNVVPGEVTLELDGRILPGYRVDDFMKELKSIIGPDVELEITRHDQGPGEPVMGLFNILASVLRDLDPESTPIPSFDTGVTDARFFSQLGIQTYGFEPMNLPMDLNYYELIHAANERIPVESVVFGANAIFEVLKRYNI